MEYSVDQGTLGLDQMDNQFHPATFIFGTIDCLSIILNVISTFFFPKISRILNSEVIILMFTLVALSLVSLSLFIIKLFDLVQSALTEQMHLFTTFAPVSYHIIVPAILMKAAAFFDKNYKSGINSYLYSGVILFSIFHVVMIISPINGFDHRETGTVHTAHEGLHMSMSTPLLLLVGAVPQFLGTVLMLRVSLEISKAASQKEATQRSLSLSVSGLDILATENYIQHLARTYFVRWSTTTALLAFPSFFISFISYCVSLRGNRAPHYFGYFQAACDSLIFFTQPVNMTVLWVMLVVKNLPPKKNISSRKNSSQAACTVFGGTPSFCSTKYPTPSSRAATPLPINTMPTVISSNTNTVNQGTICPTPPMSPFHSTPHTYGGAAAKFSSPQNVYITENGNYTFVPMTVNSATSGQSIMIQPSQNYVVSPITTSQPFSPTPSGNTIGGPIGMGGAAGGGPGAGTSTGGGAISAGSSVHSDV